MLQSARSGLGENTGGLCLWLVEPGMLQAGSNVGLISTSERRAMSDERAEWLMSLEDRVEGCKGTPRGHNMATRHIKFGSPVDAKCEVRVLGLRNATSINAHVIEPTT